MNKAKGKFVDIARVMADAAMDKGYLAGQIVAIEELAAPEKDFFVRAAAEVMQQVATPGELDRDELLALFVFVYAKAGETVFKWHHGGSDLNVAALDDMLSGKAPMSGDAELLAYFSKLRLAEDMAIAFSDWNADNPAYCAANSIQPLLPLLEALKWTWRIAADVAVRHLEAR